MPAGARSQQFLAFVFSEMGSIAALWQQVGSRTQIISRSNLISSQERSLNEACEVALEELGEDGLAVKQVLFAVPASWTQDGELLEQQKKLLRKLTEDLMLEPMGFVLLEDTLLAWQEMQLGDTFTGTVITNSPDVWRIQRVEEGSTISREEVGKSGEDETDWQELQARLQALTDDHRRALYIDFSPTPNEYDQIIVKLRQTLQVPVEKIRSEQLAEIAITQGGKEVLMARDTPPLEEPSLQINTPLRDEPENEFRTPSFIAPHEEEELMPLEELTPDEEAREDSTPAKPRFSFSFPKLRLPQTKFGLPRNRRLLIPLIVGGLVLLSVVAGYAWFSFQYTATVEVTLESQNLETTEMLTLGDSASESAELFQALSPETVTESITVEKETPTTGTRITGDPAKGKIRIYNKTEDEKSFSAGTELTVNNLKFTLDSDIRIASASSKENTGSRTIEFGSLETNVTASAIGPDSNIGKDQKLRVANFSESTYEAVSLDAFSGGSSREIQAVAQNDINNAVADLKDQALGELQDTFSQQSSGEETIFFANELTVREQASSAQAGEEAKTVRVQLTVEGKAYRLARDRILAMAEELFANRVPEGYLLRESSITLEPQRVQEGPPPQVELKITAQAVPDVQPNRLYEMIAGEYHGRAKTLLEESPGVAQAEVAIQPEWAGALFPSVPQKSDRVKFNLKLK